MRAAVNSTNASIRKLAQSGNVGFTAMNRVTVGAREFRRTLRDLTIIMAGVSFAFHAMQRAAHGTLGNIVRINAEIERMTKLLEGMATTDDPFATAVVQVDTLRKLAK